MYNINWRKGNTFETLAGHLPVHEVCAENLPALGVLSQNLYPQEPTTKDSTHMHRTQIRVANDTVLDLTKPQFLSNSDNKQSFVDY